MITDEQLSLFLLLRLYAAADAGATEELLAMKARTDAWPSLTVPELQTTLRQMADRRWVLAWKPALSGPRWRITDQGTNLLREQNLA